MEFQEKHPASSEPGIVVTLTMREANALLTTVQAAITATGKGIEVVEECDKDIICEIESELASILEG
jgi:hypothetical protein